MAAAGTSPALNLREKLAELAGLKQRVSPDLVRCDFSNLVTNGTFDTDTDWTKGTGWTIGSGVATGGPASARLEQPVNAVQGRSYNLGVTVTAYTSGDIFGRIGTTAASNGAAITTVATYSQTLVASSTAQFQFDTGGGGFTGSIDNVSLYEADPSDDAPWLRLPYGYKVGKRGMIVRDGVVLHPSDYTEITDSGQTWIKPITAPGVSTEFSIWAGA